jgi:Na+/melibiose symporter-like transporter
LSVIVASCVAAAAQNATVSPTSLSFGNQIEGITSAIKNVTLKNGQTKAITISSVSTNLSDYAATNNCAQTLAAGASCTISVTFTPAAAGSRAGTLTIIDT